VAVGGRGGCITEVMSQGGGTHDGTYGCIMHEIHVAELHVKHGTEEFDGTDRGSGGGSDVQEVRGTGGHAVVWWQPDRNMMLTVEPEFRH
jgi:hypothetical protein